MNETRTMSEMSDTVTVTVELPVHALRTWQRVYESDRHTYEEWMKRNGNIDLVAARVYLALLDVELPEPLKEGDKVRNRAGSGGRIVAIHGEHAWVEGPNVPTTYRLADLVRVEGEDGER